MAEEGGDRNLATGLKVSERLAAWFHETITTCKGREITSEKDDKLPSGDPPSACKRVESSSSRRAGGRFERSGSRVETDDAAIQRKKTRAKATAMKSRNARETKQSIESVKGAESSVCKLYVFSKRKEKKGANISCTVTVYCGKPTSWSVSLFSSEPTETVSDAPSPSFSCANRKRGR